MKYIKYFGLVGLAVFAYIIWAIGIDNIIQSFLQMNLLLFAIALLILVPIILLKAYKQSLLVNGFGVKLGILDSAKIWLIGFFFSIITPGKSGDVIKCVYISDKTTVSVGKGLLAVVVERFFDVAVLFALTLLGIFVMSSFLIFDVDLFIPILAIFLLFLACTYLLTKKNLVFVVFRPFYRFFIPKRFNEKIKGGLDEFFDGVKIYKSKKGLMLKAGLLTVLLWVISAIQYYVLALSLNIPISFEYLFLIMPIVNLLGILPIAFNGIGTREFSLVFFFALVSLPASSAVSFSLLVFIATILLGVPGFLLTLGEKKKVF